LTAKTLALLLMLTSLLVACTGSRHPTPAASQAVPEAGANSQASSPQPAPAPQPVAPAPSGENAPLANVIRAALIDQGFPPDAVSYQVVPLPLTPVPEGYTQLVATAADYKLFLFAANADGAKLKLLDKLDDAMINMAKLQISVQGGQISMWSQQPVSAFEVRTIASWDGSKLKLVRKTTADPSQDLFTRKAELVKKGDLEALMPLGKDILYPDRYREYYTLPKPILELAHQKALERYRAGNAAEALRLMRFGVDQYTLVYGDLLSDTPRYADHKPDMPARDEQAEMLNDFAFFLAETGDDKAAEPLLLRVVPAAPDRAVAYLNLGDVSWNLGKLDEARRYYQRYLNLLGANRSAAPQRVSERLK
jgi:tetratricopeptide (TPR) repeat protein